MSKPDLSTILDNAMSHASSNAHLPSLADLLPQTQGIPPSHAAAGDQAPNAHSQADLHAGAGIIDHAATHTDVTLPDLVSLTGHDWFVHS
jgi:hypothetical protein